MEMILAAMDSMLGPVTAQFEPLHFPQEALWMGPRDALEHDTRFRQLVPYVILRHDGKVAEFRRVGGDSRLEGRRSIGLGGHVNISDVAHDSIGGIDVHMTIRRAACREVFEEVDIGWLRDRHDLGVIRVSHDPVSAVHVGIVQVWDIEEPEVKPVDDSMEFLGWHDPVTMGLWRHESWSSMCVRYLRSQEIDNG